MQIQEVDVTQVSILIPVFLEMSRLSRLSAIILTTLARILQVRTLELAGVSPHSG